MKKTKHCKSLTTAAALPSKAQAGDPRSALEIKKAGLVEAGIIIQNARRGKPWFS